MPIFRDLSIEELERNPQKGEFKKTWPPPGLRKMELVSQQKKTKIKKGNGKKSVPRA